MGLAWADGGRGKKKKKKKNLKTIGSVGGGGNGGNRCKEWGAIIIGGGF